MTSPYSFMTNYKIPYSSDVMTFPFGKTYKQSDVCFNISIFELIIVKLDD